MKTNWLGAVSTLALAMVTISFTACGSQDMNGVAEPSSDESASDDGTADDADVLGTTEMGLATCANPEGTASIMAAVAVSAAQEMKRWQPTKDFAVGRVDNNEALVISATGKSRCSDGVCAKTQALLDFQKTAAQGKVKFPGNVTLDVVALRSRMVAKYRDQIACEMQPSNGGTTNCPVEEHVLTFQKAVKGGCDTNFFFQAKGVNGAALKYPAQLKNKLLWADRANQYIGFQSVGDVVSIDPTYGLNDDNTTTTGSCVSACTKISLPSVAGGCCSCNGVNKVFAKASWSAVTFLCQ